MSWDIFVQNFPPDAKTVADISGDFQPLSIGKRSQITDSIRSFIPAADFSDLAWGLIEGGSVEINLGQEEDCRSFVFHVRGGEAALGAVGAILQRLNLRALDSQTGAFFVADHRAIESFRRWRRYQDQVTGRTSP